MSGTIDIDERIRMTIEANGMAWWEMELPSGAVFFHPNKAAMFGGKPEDFVHYTHFTDRLSKKEYKAAMLSMERHLSGEDATYSAVYTLKNIDGELRRLFDKGRIISTEEDGTIKVMGIIVDITDVPL